MAARVRTAMAFGTWMAGELELPIKVKDNSHITATRDILSTVPVGVEDGFYRAAILHWFNERTLKATNRSGHLTTIGRRRQRPEDPKKLYAALRQLPFIEEYPDRGHAIHNAARDTALRHLWASERKFYKTISAQAARYFGRQMRTKQGSQGGTRQWLSRPNWTKKPRTC